MTSTIIPTSPDQVTEDWLISVLQETHNGKVEVLELFPISEKNGVMSSVFKAKMKIDEVTINLFIKTVLDENDPGRQFGDVFAFGKREILFYKSVFKELVQHEKKNCQESLLEGLIPTFYSGNYSSEHGKCGYYLIMEDLSDEYQLKRHEDGFNKNDCILILQRLARFHAVSHGFISSNQDLVKSWNLEPSHAKYKSDLQTKDFFNNYEKIVDFIVKRSPELKQPLDALKPNWCEVFDKAFFLGDHMETRFFIHGDFWLNNLLFNSSNCKFIDWEDFTFGNPALDLGFFFGTCLSESNIEEWMDSLMIEYLDFFEATCNEMNVQSPIERIHFLDYVENNGMLAMGLSCLLWFDEASPLLPRMLYTIKRSIERLPYKSTSVLTSKSELARK